MLVRRESVVVVGVGLKETDTSEGAERATGAGEGEEIERGGDGVEDVVEVGHGGKGASCLFFWLGSGVGEGVGVGADAGAGAGAGREGENGGLEAGEAVGDELFGAVAEREGRGGAGRCLGRKGDGGRRGGAEEERKRGMTSSTRHIRTIRHNI